EAAPARAPRPATGGRHTARAALHPDGSTPLLRSDDGVRLGERARPPWRRAVDGRPGPRRAPRVRLRRLAAGPPAGDAVPGLDGDGGGTGRGDRRRGGPAPGAAVVGDRMARSP